MTTLVTGASGFIGSHLTRLLVQHGHRVRALVRSTSRVDALQGLSIDVVRADLRDRAALDAAIRGAEWVFHVAADYRLWARNPREIYDNNVEGYSGPPRRVSRSRCRTTHLYQQRRDVGRASMGLGGR